MTQISDQYSQFLLREQLKLHFGSSSDIIEAINAVNDLKDELVLLEARRRGREEVLKLLESVLSILLAVAG